MDLVANNSRDDDRLERMKTIRKRRARKYEKRHERRDDDGKVSKNGPRLKEEDDDINDDDDDDKNTNAPRVTVTQTQVAAITTPVIAATQQSSSSTLRSGLFSTTYSLTLKSTATPLQSSSASSLVNSPQAVVNQPAATSSTFLASSKLSFSTQLVSLLEGSSTASSSSLLSSAATPLTVNDGNTQPSGTSKSSIAPTAVTGIIDNETAANTQSVPPMSMQPAVNTIFIVTMVIAIVVFVALFAYMKHLESRQEQEPVPTATKPPPPGAPTPQGFSTSPPYSGAGILAVADDKAYLLNHQIHSRQSSLTNNAVDRQDRMNLVRTDLLRPQEKNDSLTRALQGGNQAGPGLQYRGVGNNDMAASYVAEARNIDREKEVIDVYADDRMDGNQRPPTALMLGGRYARAESVYSQQEKYRPYQGGAGAWAEDQRMKNAGGAPKFVG